MLTGSSHTCGSFLYILLILNFLLIGDTYYCALSLEYYFSSIAFNKFCTMWQMFYLKCSGYKFCLLEILLVVYFSFVFPVNALFAIWIFSYRFSFLINSLYRHNGIYILVCGIIVVVVVSRIICLLY